MPKNDTCSGWKGACALIRTWVYSLLFATHDGAAGLVGAAVVDGAGWAANETGAISAREMARVSIFMNKPARGRNGNVAHAGGQHQRQRSRLLSYPQHRALERAGGNRLAQQVALQDIAPQQAQQLGLVLVLYALGHDLERARMRKTDDVRHQGHGLG